MNTEPTLVILAAGMGSRYGGLKQIDPVGPNGEIVIDYSIYDALQAGFEKLVFVIRRDIEAEFKEAVGAKYEGRVEVEYVFQELDRLPEGYTVPEGRKKPWGTAHAVLTAADAVAGPFAAINADDFYGRHSYQLLHDHLVRTHEADPPEYAIVGFILRNTLSEFGSVARGICEHDEHRLLQSVLEMKKIERDGDAAFNTDDDGERIPLTGDECVSMNMWGFTPSFFTYGNQLFKEFLDTVTDHSKSEFYIPDVITWLIREDKARTRILPSSESWFGVTYPDDKPQVVERIRQLIDQGVYPTPLWAPT